MKHLFLLFLLPFFLVAKEKICLNMIVKNQVDAIGPCLDSAKSFIDSWVIIDLGSTDGTQDLIRQRLRDIPGMLYERSWKSFGENRTEALELAKSQGGYLLFLDAQDVLTLEKNFKFPALDKDIYYSWQGTANFSSLRPLLAKANLPLKWVGVTHEYLDCEKPHTKATLLGIRSLLNGGRVNVQDPKKAWNQVKLLEKALKDDPQNHRYAFYLAENYRDAGEKGKALECFQKRVRMGGWEEEVFWSKLQIAHMLRDLGLPPAIAIEAYKEAHAYRPHRPEPVYYLSQLYQAQNDHAKSYELLKAQEKIVQPPQKDVLFNQEWIDRYGLLFQLSLCTYYIGKYEECFDLCNQLLMMDTLPKHLQEQVSKNRFFPLSKIEECHFGNGSIGSSATRQNRP
ncbi:MAG TPA: glycosyltransferase [Chlamydiales bacterium]|nr:glycosyltransferase [Chlamydiales bacterium]